MTLLKIVTEFRRGILGGRKSKGRCWQVCWPLTTFLNMMGHECKLVEGWVGDEHHVWIELSDGRILDPTADQFRDMPKVFIGEKPDNYTID